MNLRRGCLHQLDRGRKFSLASRTDRDALAIGCGTGYSPNPRARPRGPRRAARPPLAFAATALHASTIETSTFADAVLPRASQRQNPWRRCAGPCAPDGRRESEARGTRRAPRLPFRPSMTPTARPGEPGVSAPSRSPSAIRTRASANRPLRARRLVAHEAAHGGDVAPLLPQPRLRASVQQAMLGQSGCRNEGHVPVETRVSAVGWRSISHSTTFPATGSSIDSASAVASQPCPRASVRSPA